MPAGLFRVKVIEQHKEGRPWSDPEREYVANISNQWHHVESLGPFDTAAEAEKAGKRRKQQLVKEHNEQSHWLNRRF